MTQCLQEQRRIVLDTADPIACEELGQDAPLHDPVLDHVGHTGGRAQIVLEHQIATVLVADQIDPTDVGIDVVRRGDVHDLAPEVLAAVDQLGRHDAVLEDPLTVIEILQEEIQGPDALFESGFDLRPLDGRDDAREDVEGPDALDALLVVGVDGEGHPFGVQRQMGIAGLGPEDLLAGGLNMLPHRPVVIARPEVVLIELMVGHRLSRALHLDLTGAAGLELSKHLREPHNMAHNG